MWKLYLSKLIFKNLPVWDFLGGPVVKNLPSKKKKRKEESAFQNRTGSLPGWGTKMAHAKGELSPRASTDEGPLLQQRLRTAKSNKNKKTQLPICI